LIDLGLPDGSSIGLIKTIRQYSTNTQVVVATFFEDTAHLLNALRASAEGYLRKSEWRKILISHLKGIAASRAPLSTNALIPVMDHFSQRAPPAELIALTTREEEVLQLAPKGFNVTEPANLLGLSANTVKSDLKAVYSKLGNLRLKSICVGTPSPGRAGHYCVRAAPKHVRSSQNARPLVLTKISF
jgi:DNA-binding NarL/FixJ family response regulator